MARTVLFGSSLARGTAGMLGALLIALGPGFVSAATITVTTTQDELANDGDCSLRGAIRAANLNAAQDACPAGDSTGSDQIILADGATYALALSGTDQTALAGDLDIVNNASAAPDLIITVANGGTATISQGTVADGGVFELLPSASLQLQRLTIRDGTSTSNGGAVTVGSGAALTVTDCEFVDNLAGNNGGAILVDGSLDAIGSTFSGNVASGGGGAIFLASSSAGAQIVGSRFEDNVSAQAGGAVRNSGALLSIVTSTFVANRGSSGGAVFANTSGGSSVVSSSCFVGNSDEAVDFAGAAGGLVVSGNWWGAADGPSGAGSGSGDAVAADVDFTGFFVAPPAACGPLELVQNRGFDLDDDVDGDPDRWRLRRLQAATDGQVCDSNGCTLDMTGDGQRNEALQTILASGAAGDGVTIRAVSSADAVPESAGKYLVELTLVHQDGSNQRKTLKFSPGTHGPEEITKTIVATEPFSRLKVRIEYGRASGIAHFEEVSVVLD